MWPRRWLIWVQLRTVHLGCADADKCLSRFDHLGCADAASDMVTFVPIGHKEKRCGSIYHITLIRYMPKMQRSCIQQTQTSS
jgi:hypothetical protein